ncbi:Outer membrane protein 26 [Pseudoprimorskyibacter insulae]|uniref:Outer membrane protein 26 n=2 Tax=Pseudoprimorskyibacter insulae TaxID=1695997 RepID=A0A2R8AWE4_9RHOB|nr:Outer membrane protein 26 [Pseudoprimorskyibacter insulae]
MPAAAQQALSAGAVQAQILVIEPDRLYSETILGKGLSAKVDEQGAAIAAENREIEAQLTAEERDLTEKRKALSMEEFRPLANAFDEKVQQLRQQQDTKVRALGALSDDSRRQFLVTIQPVLAGLMQEAGAVLVLDKRGVFASVEAINITEAAIARIDAEFGSEEAGTPADQ